MLKGEQVKAVVYVDRDLLAQLKVALAMDQISMSEWFRSHARVYVQAKGAIHIYHRQ